MYGLGRGSTSRINPAVKRGFKSGLRISILTCSLALPTPAGKVNSGMRSGLSKTAATSRARPIMLAQRVILGRMETEITASPM